MFFPGLTRSVHSTLHTGAWRASPVRVAAFFSSWQVSSLGRTKNTRGQVFLGSEDFDGYRRVQLTLPSKVKKNFYVHRLVAFAFHGPPSSPLLVVNHIDRNPGNNRPENLKYVTQAENIRHSLRARTSQIPEARSGKAVMVRPVGEQSWVTYPSIRRAAEALGVHRSSVSHCCRGKQLTCQGHEIMLAQATDLPGEIWAAAVCPKTRRSILGYQVSTHGRVQGPTAFITHGSDLKGYRRIMVRGVSVLVHRIVAATFLKVPNTNVDWEIDHKDGNGVNNVVGNLEVVTHSENMCRAWAMRKSRGVMSTRKPVRGRRLLTDIWTSFSSVSEAADHVGGHVSNIIECCKGHRRTSGGYEWEYNDTDEPDIASAEEWRKVDVQGVLAAWDSKVPHAKVQHSRGQANSHYGTQPSMR